MARTVAESRPPLRSTTARLGLVAIAKTELLEVCAAAADVHRRRDGIALVNVGLDALAERAFGFEDELDGVARSAIAAGVERDVVCLGVHLVARVGDSNGEADLAHGRQVNDVV